MVFLCLRAIGATQLVVSRVRVAAKYIVWRRLARIGPICRPALAKMTATLLDEKGRPYAKLRDDHLEDAAFPRSEERRVGKECS